jgi:hypothetical protein
MLIVVDRTSVGMSQNDKLALSQMGALALLFGFLIFSNG